MTDEKTKKWVKTLSDQQAVEEGCFFDLKHAERVRDFLHKFCRQSIGEFAGQPLDLLPWQWNDLVAPLYSWRRPDGTRRFRQASVWIPKNNGKSTSCAGLSLYHLIADNEPGAQVVNLAATVEQAGIVYRSACDMVSQSPALEKLLWVRKNIKAIEYDRTRSTYKVMSGERGGGKHGFSISCLIFDELAEQGDRELWDTMRHNLMKRKNSLLVSISTAGFRRESIGYEQFVYAQKVLNGEIIDTAFLPVVYAASPEDAWGELETFKKVNPSFGVTIHENDVQTLLNEAKNEPRKEAAYRTLRLNQWCGAATCWISALKWSACAEAFKEEDLHGLDAWVGIDYAWRGDLCAAVLVVENNDKVYLMPRFFTPRKHAAHKEETDHVPYSSWARNPDLHLTLTDGDTIDYKAIRESLLTDSKNFNFVEVGYDPTGLGETAKICEEEYGWRMVAVPQKARFTGPAAVWLERAVLEGTSLRHPDNPVLNWCLENTAAKETSDGLYLYKGSGETQRIDGIQAAVMAISRYLVREPKQDGAWIVWL